MRRFVPFALLFAAALAVAGCDDDDTPTLPSDPPQSVTAEFPVDGPGTLVRNGGVTHEVLVGGSGPVTATLTTLSPDSTLVIGMSLGTLNGLACSTVIANDRATQGTIIAGASTGAGALCVRVYDSMGNVTNPVNYRVTVTHF